MKKDQVAGLVNPDISGDMADLNLPVLATVTLRKTFGDMVGDGTEAVNGNDKFTERTSGSEVVTKFGLHHGDSVRVFLMFVNG